MMDVKNHKYLLKKIIDSREDNIIAALRKEKAYFDLEQENKDLRIKLEELEKKFDEKTDDGCESESLKVRDEQGIPLELAVLRREYVSMIKYAELGWLFAKCSIECEKENCRIDICDIAEACQKRAELLGEGRQDGQ
jgi:hypothetical protein